MKTMRKLTVLFTALALMLTYLCVPIQATTVTEPTLATEPTEGILPAVDTEVPATEEEIPADSELPAAPEEEALPTEATAPSTQEEHVEENMTQSTEEETTGETTEVTTEETIGVTTEESTGETTEETTGETTEDSADGTPEESAPAIVASGTCGDNLTWTLDSEGLLVISGTGDMYNFQSNIQGEMPPWPIKDIVKVRVDSGVTSIGRDAFYTSGLTSNLIEVTLPDTLTKIYGHAFAGTSITEVTIPNSVTLLGSSAFSGCKNLTSINLPSKLTEIRKGLFSGCSSLTEITIPASVTKIDRFAFSGCTALSDMLLPSNLQYIGESAFEGCTGFKYLVIPDSVKEINTGAFSNCTSLIIAQLPSELTTLANCLFLDCTALQAVIIPATLVYIDTNAFSGCTALSEVHFLGSDKQINAIEIDKGNGPFWDAEWYYLTLATKHPKDVKTIAGKTVSFSTEASRSNCTFQWYYLTPGSEEWKVCSGSSAKKATYSFTAKESMDGYLFCCLITDEYGSEFTCNSATLTIVPAPKIVKQPENAIVNLGEEASVTVEATGTGLTYQWYYAKAGSSKFAATSVTDPTYSVTMTEARDGRQLYCLITDDYGQKVKTQVVTISINKTPLEIVTQPKSVTVASGEQASVTVEATGDGLTYQWYYAKAGSKKYTKTSVTGPTYSVTMSAGRDGRKLYCIVKDAYGRKVKTNVVTITMDITPSPVVTQNSAGKPHLTWNKIGLAQKYYVYRVDDNGARTSLGSTTKTYFTDTKAEVGTTYTYQVRTYVSKTRSAYSENLSCLCICGQPAVSISISSATGKPSLSWKAISGAVSYDIYRATSADGPFELLVNQTGVTFSDTTAAPETNYWYKVNALGAQEALNSVDGVAKKAYATLARPDVTFSIDSKTGKPKLSWDAVDGATSYKIYRSSYSKKKYKAIKTVTDTEFLDTSVKVAKGYYYKVIAIGENSKSAYSSYKKLTAKCAQPQVTATQNSAGKPYLTWGKVSGAKKYYVYRVDENGSRTSLGTTTKTYFADKKAALGTTYTYQVRAYGSKSAYKGAYSESVSCLCICSQPTVTVSVVAATGKPTLSWKAIPGAVSYEIYRSENDGEYAKVSAQTATSYTDEAAILDSKYSYKVIAIAQNPEWNSAESAAKSIYCACGNPTITGTRNGKKPMVSWEPVEGATKYYVYRSTKKSSGYKKIATVEGESYTDKKAKKGTTYYYKVIAVSENTSSAYSNYAKIKSN